MKGARDYAKYFEAEQFGRLYIVSGRHARGCTFQIYVLPAGEEATKNGPGNPPLNKDAVCVYGVVGGNPGWTEEYGWIHTGPWCADFEALLRSKEMAHDAAESARCASTVEYEQEKKARTANLLKTYAEPEYK